MTSTRAEALLIAAARQWGAGAARAAGSDDAVCACQPQIVLEPRDPAALGEMLRWAGTEGLAVRPRGGGTKIGWSGPPSRWDAVLSTARLNASIDHCAGDLTATVSSGATLAAVNERLGREGQWLPLDPPQAARATIGGILATNDSGPRRYRHGAPRDLVIGIEMVLADGRRAKAGGRVVKNVAGYDLSRLMCGSFGSLAVITSATFKLAPVPPASVTVIASVPDTRALTSLALAVAATPVTPSAIEISSPPHRLLVRFESTSTAGDKQAVAVKVLCERHGADVVTVGADAERQTWMQHEERVWHGDGTLIKSAVPPTEAGAMIARAEGSAAERSVGLTFAGRGALGVIYFRLAGTDDAVVGVVSDLRLTSRGCHGSVVVQSAPSAVKTRVDSWGEVGDARPTMQAVKTRFDPDNVLSPGCGPGGL